MWVVKSENDEEIEMNVKRFDEIGNEHIT